MQLAKIAAQIAEDKKGIDVVVLSVKRFTIIADYFVIATAESTPQINAIIETIRKTFREKEGISAVHSEGKYSPFWAVIDYGGVVIHVMSPHARSVYALEKIWHVARKIKWGK